MLMRLFYVALATTAYVLAFTRYAPSDVTPAFWMDKTSVMILVGIIATVFFGLRMIRIFVFSPKEKRVRRVFYTIFLLPTYAILAFFLAIDANGIWDKEENKREWPTNLIYYKDVKIACLVGAIDDQSINAGVREAIVLFVPRKHCKNIVDDVRQDRKYPYIVSLSSGKLDIPYVTGIEKDVSRP